MAENLYPVFDIPAQTGATQAQTQRYHPAPCFDFDAGDFVRDGGGRVVMCDGEQAYRQWCHKMLLTQKGACLAYTALGVAGEEAQRESTPAAVRSALERAISEALLAHPGTKRVSDFSYEIQGEVLRIAFIVYPYDMAAFTMDYTVLGR